MYSLATIASAFEVVSSAFNVSIFSYLLPDAVSFCLISASTSHGVILGTSFRPVWIMVGRVSIVNCHIAWFRVPPFVL